MPRTLSQPQPRSALVLSSAFDTSGHVRRARRLADLNQRELAARVGLPQSSIARIEDGRDVSVRDFALMLAVAGLQLAVVDAQGRAVAPMPPDVHRDGAGRRRPAHLDVHALPEPPTTKMLLHACDPVPAGGAWHHLRAERDRLRRLTAADGSSEQLTISGARDRRAHRRPGTPSQVPPAPGDRVRV